MQSTFEGALHGLLPDINNNVHFNGILTMQPSVLLDSCKRMRKGLNLAMFSLCISVVSVDYFNTHNFVVLCIYWNVTLISFSKYALLPGAPRFSFV